MPKLPTQASIPLLFFSVIINKTVGTYRTEEYLAFSAKGKEWVRVHRVPRGRSLLNGAVGPNGLSISVRCISVAKFNGLDSVQIDSTATIRFTQSSPTFSLPINVQTRFSGAQTNRFLRLPNNRGEEKKKNGQTIATVTCYKGQNMAMKKKPEWLDSLLGNEFFGVCEDHKELRKSEINTYCIDCDTKMCQHCLLCPNSANYVHVNHKLLQIRRYVYQDVVRILDVHKLLDCSKIQPFVVNGAKVILLNPKKNCKASNTKEAHVCVKCGRTITDPNVYCSIACKVSDEGGGNETKCHQSGSLISSLTADLGRSSSFYYLDDHPCTDEYFDCWKKVPVLKRRRKGVPRRSYFY